ncbi:MAG TPA: cyclic nucleotide-binding domain-containing protein [Gaiellaceae bacterium]|nr:cyclic nucleotide-binding domain-containing protein [Gaiellaceae bacterium]
MDPTRLAQIPLFADLGPDRLERVAAACNELQVDEGETLLREGDFGYSLFAITAGTAEVLQDGVVIRTLRPGDVFGEIAVLSGGRRTATVVATSALELMVLFNRDLWRLEHNAPDVVAALRETITARLGEPAVTGS